MQRANRNQLENIWTRYTIAIMLAVAAQLVRIPLDPPTAIPFISYVPFVAVAAFIEGLGPGLVATILCGFESLYYANAPTHTLAIADPSAWLGLASFVFAGAVTSILVERLRVAERQSRRKNRELGEQARLLEEQGHMLSLAQLLVRNFSDDRITFWNHGAEQFYGYSAEEAVGKRAHEVLRTVFPEPPASIRRQLERTGTWNGELVHTRKNGSSVTVASHWMLYRDESDQPRAIIQSDNDITGLRYAEEALLITKEKYRSLAESMPIFVWAAKPDGCIEYCNERWTAYTGLDLQATQGTGWAAVIHGDDLEHAQERMSAALSSQSPVEFSCSVRRAWDGNYRSHLFRSNPLLTPAGQISGWVMVGMDVHDRQLANQQQVLEQTAQWEATTKELEAFTYSVSHDLRAPLRAIDGFSRILIEEHASELGEEARHCLDIVRTNALRMNELIDHLLTLSRLTRKQLNKQTIHPKALVEEVVKQLASEKKDRQVDISIEELPDCSADPALLRQVFAHLLSNALKFTRTRPVAKIEVGAMASGASDPPTYYVRDNGVGFDLRYAEKLFDVFQRLHAAEQYEGAGVGLAIVHRIVTRHGGRVWAEAAVDRGATFYFTLARTEVVSIQEREPCLASA